MVVTIPAITCVCAWCPQDLELWGLCSDKGECQALEHRPWVVGQVSEPLLAPMTSLVILLTLLGSDGWEVYVGIGVPSCHFPLRIDSHKVPQISKCLSLNTA